MEIGMGMGIRMEFHAVASVTCGFVIPKSAKYYPEFEFCSGFSQKSQKGARHGGYL